MMSKMLLLRRQAVVAANMVLVRQVVADSAVTIDILVTKTVTGGRLF